MNGTETVIFSWTYRHKGREFAVWSYLDGKNAESSSMLFAFSLEGETVVGLPDREQAIRKARQRGDELPAKAVEEMPAAGPPQQAELALA
jgi:hypothetical protein